MSDKENKGFLLYPDMWDSIHYLSMEQRGQLFSAIFDYVREGNLPEFPGGEKDNLPLLMAFSPIKNSLDRNAVKYDEICRKRAESGRKGGKASAQSKIDKASATNCNQLQANQADNESDTDTDSDTDNENGTEKKSGSCSDTAAPAIADSDNDNDNNHSISNIRSPSSDEVMEYAKVQGWKNEKTLKPEIQKFIDYNENSVGGWQGKRQNWQYLWNRWMEKAGIKPKFTVMEAMQAIRQQEEEKVLWMSSITDEEWSISVDKFIKEYGIDGFNYGALNIFPVWRRLLLHWKQSDEEFTVHLDRGLYGLSNLMAPLLLDGDHIIDYSGRIYGIENSPSNPSQAQQSTIYIEINGSYPAENVYKDYLLIFKNLWTDSHVSEAIKDKYLNTISMQADIFWIGDGNYTDAQIMQMVLDTVFPEDGSSEDQKMDDSSADEPRAEDGWF